jgi:hypothetical protein
LEKLYLTRFSQLEDLKPTLSCIASYGRSLRVLNLGKIQRVFHRKLPFVNTVFSDDLFADYGIAVPDVEK